MPTSYASSELLHQAYASEPDRVARGWIYWSETVLADGSIEVLVTLVDSTTETWTAPAGGGTLTLQP